MLGTAETHLRSGRRICSGLARVRVQVHNGGMNSATWFVTISDWYARPAPGHGVRSAVAVRDDDGERPVPAQTLLYALPPTVGVVIGYLWGGRLRHLATVRLRAVWLVWLAAAAQLAATALVSGTAATVLSASAFAMAAVCMVLNLARCRAAAIAGTVVLVGAGANALAILLNGGMPYSATAAHAVGLTVDDETVRNTVAGEGTRLPWLGDVIAVPPLGAVVSAGDLLIAIGIVGLVASLMRPRPLSHRRWRPSARDREEGGGTWLRSVCAD